MDTQDRDIRDRLTTLLPFLNDQQMRLFAGYEAKKYGRGGAGKVAEFSGLSTYVVRKGMKELREMDKATAHKIKTEAEPSPPEEPHPLDVYYVKELMEEEISRLARGRRGVWVKPNPPALVQALAVRGVEMDERTVRSILVRKLGYKTLSLEPEEDT